MTRGSRTASDVLTRALLNLANRGGRPRCGDPATHDYWLSESAEERALAAAWCTGCPVLTECHEAAEAGNERFGVWAGADRTPRPKPNRKEAAVNNDENISPTPAERQKALRKLNRLCDSGVAREAPRRPGRVPRSADGPRTTQTFGHARHRAEMENQP